MSMEDSQPPISSSLPTSDILISTSSLPPANLTSKPTVSDEDTKLSETQKMLQQLFQDPLLSDLTKYISNENNRTLFNKKNTSNNNTIDESSLTATINSLTLEQVDTLIALELGTAFEITVLRCGLEPLSKCLKKFFAIFYKSNYA
jgi:hypothetical protein